MSQTINFRETVDKVNKWAKVNATGDYFYGAPYSYWGVALASKIITKAEYDRAAAWYGPLWTYRGD